LCALRSACCTPCSWKRRKHAPMARQRGLVQRGRLERLRERGRRR
jgi:hypothetical protein